MNKVYKGIRGMKGWEDKGIGIGVKKVTVNNEPLEHHIYHSPDGFEWGYAGSGPADLAIAILWDFLGEEPDHGTAMLFKNEIVSNFGRMRWVLRGNEIEKWLNERISAGLINKQRAMELTENQKKHFRSTIDLKGYRYWTGEEESL